MCIFFLFLHKNIYTGYSLEVPHWSASNEYPQYRLSWRNKKNIFLIPPLIWSYGRYGNHDTRFGKFRVSTIWVKQNSLTFPWLFPDQNSNFPDQFFRYFAQSSGICLIPFSQPFASFTQPAVIVLLFKSVFVACFNMFVCS